MNEFLELAGKAKKKWDSLAPRKREILSRVILLLPLCTIPILTGLNFRLIGDEGPWTLRVVEKFSREWPVPDILNYPSSTTPLPYLLFTVFGKVFGFEIWKLRLLTVVLTFLAINLFYDLCRQYKLPSPLLGALSLLFFPYVFFHGFTIYTVCFALFFEILALKYYLVDAPTLKDLLKGSVAATFAVYCRQEYLAIPFGLLLYELLRIPSGKFLSTVKNRFLHLIVLAMPLFLALPLFIVWGGVNPPLQQTEFYLTIVPQHLTFIAIFVGLYFLPALLNQNLKKLLDYKKRVLVIFLILTPIFIFFPLTYNEEMAVGKGIISHGLSLLGQYLGNVTEIVAKAFLWAVGTLLVIAEVVVGRRDSIKMTLFAILISFMGFIMLTPYVAERYYIIVVAPLILIFHKSQRDWRIYFSWLIFLILMSAVFSYWQINLKSFENW
jgi:hypothetical protein